MRSILFKKLRDNFIITTMTFLAIVVVVSFTTIYATTANRLPGGARPTPRELPAGQIPTQFNNSEFRDLIDQQRRTDAETTLQNLATTLILAAVATLTAGYFGSRYLANRAIKPVQESYERQKQFIADASHELKTPLAVIDANIEAELIDAKKPSKWLKNVQKESESMNELITQLLTLAKLDGQQAPPSLAPLDVADLTSKILETHAARFSKKSLTLKNELKAPLTSISSPAELRQLLTILIDNAIKYTKKDGSVTVSATRNAGDVAILVRNTHPGLPKEKRDRLFERFYQAEKSHKTGGYGLGLPIAKVLADSIGAELSVDQVGGEIVFTVRLTQ